MNSPVAEAQSEIGSDSRIDPRFLNPGRATAVRASPRTSWPSEPWRAYQILGKPAAPHRAIGLRNIHKANARSVQLKLRQKSGYRGFRQQNTSAPVLAIPFTTDMAR